MPVEILNTLAIVAAAAIVFAIRVVARGRRSVGDSGFALRGDMSDAMTHLCLIDMIRRNGHRPVARTEDFLLGKTQDYPALYHVFLSYIPRRALERLEWSVTPAIEALHVAIVGIATGPILAKIGIEPSPLWTFSIALLWGMTPLLLHADRRLTIGERPFGFFATNGFLIASYFWCVGGSMVFLGIAALAGTVAFCSSKFGAQAIVFTSPVFAVLQADIDALAPLAAAALVGLLFTHGYAATVARGTLRHMRHYRRHLMHLHDYVVGVNLQRFAVAARLLLRGRLAAAAVELQRHPVGALLVRFPWLLPLAVATAARLGEADKAELALFAWAWAPLVVCVATSTQALKYLGEGHRYAELAVFPAILVCLLIPDGWGGGSWLLVGFPFAIHAAYRIVRRPGTGAAAPATLEFLDFVSCMAPATFLSVPGRLAFPIFYEKPGRHRYCWLFINMGDEVEMATFLALFSDGARYPYPSRRGIDVVAREFGATHLVVWLPIVEHVRRQFGFELSFDNLSVCFRNSEFAVFALPESKSHSPT